MKTIISAAFAFLLCGCALDPYHLEDPSTMAGIGPNITQVTRSLRCEVITFLVENRLRSQIRHDYLPNELVNSNKPADQLLVAQRADFVRKYPFLNIDSEQFAAIGVDLKNIDTGGINVQNDWKYLSGRVTRDYHLGPSYTDTRTFEYAPPLAIAQLADLGPAKNFGASSSAKPLPPAYKYTTAYYYQPTIDENFYCYKSLANSRSVTLPDATNELEKFVESDPSYRSYEKFDRIHVGDITLARWLVQKADELTSNQRTIYPTPESLSVGQVYYTFTLDAKPAFDARYSLTAAAVNPFLPDLSASIEHSSMFYIYLNTPDAIASITAKQGNSCNKSIKNAKCAAKKT